MSILKSFTFGLFLLCSVISRAQNLSAVFVKSYAAEKNANYAEAITAMQYQTNQNNYEVNLRLGWLFYSDKKHNEAIACYQKAIILKPNATEPLWGLIMPLSILEKWNAVAQAYLDILKLDPGNSKANYYLGSIYFYRKDYASAKKYFLNVTTLYPFDHDANLMLGWCQYYLGNYAEAKSAFYRTLNNTPDDASAKEGLALIK